MKKDPNSILKNQKGKPPYPNPLFLRTTLPSLIPFLSAVLQKKIKKQSLQTTDK
jgi:hypothetical protein